MSMRVRKPASRQFSIKVGSEELERISQARKTLDDIKVLAQFAIRYRELGWSPLALEAHAGTDLRVDFDQPQTAWINFLMDLALQEIPVRLAIRLEPDSQLFVLRVHARVSKAFLDPLGDWQSPCIARSGDTWEHHFLVRPPAWHLSAGCLEGDNEALLSVIGPGGVVLVPPSVETSGQETWQWIQPPWERPPGHPAPELLILLESCEFISRKSPKAEEDLPCGKDIFPLLCQVESLPGATIGEPNGSPGPSSSEDLMYELPHWAAKILELEQQLDSLAELPSSSWIGGQADLPPSLHKESTSLHGRQEGLNLTPPDNLAELEELLRAVEYFLEENQGLSDPDTIQLLRDCYSITLRLIRSGSASHGRKTPTGR